MRAWLSTSVACLALAGLLGCGGTDDSTETGGITQSDPPPNGLSYNEANRICSTGSAQERQELGDYCDPIVYQGGDATATEPSSADASSTTKTPEQTTTEQPTFTGQDASAYKDAETACGAFSIEQLATVLGVKTDTSTSQGISKVATAWASGYSGTARQAAFEGCLEGMRNP